MRMRSAGRAMSALWMGTALAGLALSGCATPVRTPLAAPFSLTRGGTPVPGKGVGIGLELGDGLQGQEVLRKELVTGHLLGGIGDVVNLGVGTYVGHEPRDEPGVLVTGKARLGAPAGPRTSVSLHMAFATVRRRDGTEQDESLAAVDVAVPVEWLATPDAGPAALGLYAGPRIVHERYRDQIRPAEDLDAWLPGVLGGLHLRLGKVHVFGEATVAFRPGTTYLGEAYGGSPIFLPSGGVVTHLGSPFRWDRRGG